MRTGSPVIETSSQSFCLLPSQLLGSYIPQNNYGHGKRMFTVQASFKQPLVLPSLDPLEIPPSPRVGWRREMGHQGDNDSPHVLQSLYSSEVFKSLGF